MVGLVLGQVLLSGDTYFLANFASAFCIKQIYYPFAQKANILDL
jgi:hypothetical protein